VLIVHGDAIGFGQSSKPSDGLRAGFPHYGYIDIVTAQYRLLTEGLGVNLWGERYPDFMDALMEALPR